MKNNRLEIRALTVMFNRKWFPLAVQIVFLAVFVLLIIGGLGANTSDMKFARVLRNTNLPNLLVWSYWWPAVIAGAVFFGRVWCTVCPIELVTSLLSMVGLKKKVPGWMRNGWLITIFYLAILLVGIHTLAIHRVPLRMALYMLVLFGLAVVFGLVFEKRAFCNHLCPVGPLLGLYGFCSPLEVRARDRKLCQTCPDRGCIAPENYYRLTSRSCTSELYPATLKHNRDCILCGQCFNSCPFGNMGVFLRRPFKDFFTSTGIRLSGSQTFLIYLLSGFVLYEILSEWKVTKDILTWLPNSLGAKLGLSNPYISGFTAAVVMFLVYPLLWWVVPAVVNKLAYPNVKVREYLKTIAVYFVPVLAGAHVLKSVLKTTSRIPYLKLSIEDPSGIDTAQSIISGALVLDKTIVNALQPYITVFAILALSAGTVVSLAALWKNYRSRGGPSVIIPSTGILIYGLLFLVALYFWRL
ncbi:MAG: 4Fe-4S binding protein [Gemmatimonadota bacterium]|nr:4Fe-4S binding protein [Gemmatimonadota bacterium]